MVSDAIGVAIGRITPLIVALLALYVAYTNYRLNNLPIIRLVECECSYLAPASASSGAHAEPRYSAPQHPSSPCFNEASGFGRARMPLKARVRFPEEKRTSTLREGQFAKGMYAEFSFQTDELNSGEQIFFSILKEPRKQGVFDPVL